MEAASIRVNATTLKDFPGKVVRVTGRVTSVDMMEDTATLDAGGPVHISTHGAEEMIDGCVYEIIGKASASDFKINSYSVLKCSDDTSVEMTNKLAAMVPKVAELFYKTN